MYKLNKGISLFLSIAALSAMSGVAWAANSHGSDNDTIQTLFAKPRTAITSAPDQHGKPTPNTHVVGETGKGGSVWAIAHLQTETAVLKARIALLELRLKQAKLQNELTGGAPGGIGADTKFNAPQVISIYGTPRHLESQLRYGDGTLINAETGAIIPGGAKVVSITARSVVIDYHGHRLQLAFEGGAPTTAPIVFGAWQPPKVVHHSSHRNDHGVRGPQK